MKRYLTEAFETIEENSYHLDEGFWDHLHDRVNILDEAGLATNLGNRFKNFFSSMKNKSGDVVKSVDKLTPQTNLQKYLNTAGSEATALARRSKAEKQRADIAAAGQTRNTDAAKQKQITAQLAAGTHGPKPEGDPKDFFMPPVPLAAPANTGAPVANTAPVKKPSKEERQAANKAYVAAQKIKNSPAAEPKATPVVLSPRAAARRAKGVASGFYPAPATPATIGASAPVDTPLQYINPDRPVPSGVPTLSALAAKAQPEADVKQLDQINRNRVKSTTPQQASPFAVPFAAPSRTLPNKMLPVAPAVKTVMDPPKPMGLPDIKDLPGSGPGNANGKTSQNLQALHPNAAYPRPAKPVAAVAPMAQPIPIPAPSPQADPKGALNPLLGLRSKFAHVQKPVNKIATPSAGRDIRTQRNIPAVKKPTGENYDFTLLQKQLMLVENIRTYVQKTQDENYLFESNISVEEQSRLELFAKRFVMKG